MMLDVKLIRAQTFLPLPYEAALEPRLRRIQEKLQSWNCLTGNRTECLSWLHAAAGRIRAQSQILVVLGAGPGPRGLTDCLCPSLRRTGPALVFLDGGEEMGELMEALENRDFSVAAAPDEGDPFLLRQLQPLRALLMKRYGREEGRFFLLPGGLREGWSLLGKGGLLPAAAAGADVEALLAGAEEARTLCRLDCFGNPAWRYAAIRHQLYRAGRTVELLAAYGNASLAGLLEWRQRLCAGSEGQECMGLFPAWALYPRDRSTLGRAVREGKQPAVETLVAFDGGEEGLEKNLLTYGEDGVPVILLRLAALSPETLGGLVCFFQYACALSCGLLDVDPFGRRETGLRNPLVRLTDTAGERERAAGLALRL